MTPDRLTCCSNIQKENKNQHTHIEIIDNNVHTPDKGLKSEMFDIGK